MLTRLTATLAAVLSISGCARFAAPPYSASIENVQMLRDAGIGKVKVGKFTADSKKGNDQSISLRGAPMQSPIGGRFSAYVAEALRSELASAGLIDDGTTVEIGGVLLENDVDVSGISQGTAVLRARIVVRRGSVTAYDKVTGATMTFESSFAGSVAAPKGVQAYPTLVQRFLTALYADREFIAALSR